LGTKRSENSFFGSHYMLAHATAIFEWSRERNTKGFAGGGEISSPRIGSSISFHPT
jgi:hypothetical protein